ncbi:hypothetical protein DFH11DRAFT_1557387 [Phellopilus nigrolimitatus]|nr:hypothetical protein DFH11DRAFT_1557387 [Phellopilus nigrolimitatus]
MSTFQPTLPSVLPSSPAIQDLSTTAERLKAGVGRVTSPSETPIFICGYSSASDRYIAGSFALHLPFKALIDILPLLLSRSSSPSPAQNAIGCSPRATV